MAVSPYVNFYDQLIRSRAQLQAQQRSTAYATALAGQNRSNSQRDLNLQLQQTDHTYATDILKRGLGNSGYAGLVDSQYRQNVGNRRSDIEQVYTGAVNQAMMALADQQTQFEINRQLLQAALSGQLTDNTLSQIGA